MHLSINKIIIINIYSYLKSLQTLHSTCSMQWSNVYYTYMHMFVLFDYSLIRLGLILRFTLLPAQSLLNIMTFNWFSRFKNLQTCTQWCNVTCTWGDRCTCFSSNDYSLCLILRFKYAFTNFQKRLSVAFCC